jgi:hypothetical protein
MNEAGSCPPVATVDCFQKNGEVVYRSGNFLPGLTACGTEAMTQELESPPAKTFIEALLENLVGVRSTGLSNCSYRIEQPRGDTEETDEGLVSLNRTNQPIQCLVDFLRFSSCRWVDHDHRGCSICTDVL